MASNLTLGASRPVLVWAVIRERDFSDPDLKLFRTKKKALKWALDLAEANECVRICEGLWQSSTVRIFLLEGQV